MHFRAIAILFFAFVTHVLAAKQAPVSDPVTWTRDIAPIVRQHCAGCHRPGQPAPFPLLTYEDVSRRIQLVTSVTRARYMPPWKPAHGYGEFQGDNHLTDAQIALIERWAKQGTPRGPSSAAQKEPSRFASGWQLGPPDAVVTLPKPYLVSADGPDQYRCFVMPIQLGGEHYVRAFEFAPGLTQVLHHALIFVDARRQSPGLEPYECFGTPGFFPSGALGGWSPGASAATMPPGTATHIPQGARLVIQLHFHPTGKAETVNPSIALYYASKPPTRALMDVALGSNRIDIPAGDSEYKVRESFELPVAVEVAGIIPHAHYICRDMKGWAILPNGGRRWLLWIPDWDFQWQAQYRYAKPFQLPAGTTVHMEFTYDNSNRNVRNVHHPPERVTWGAGSEDEMAGLHLQVIPHNEADMHELGQALWGKIMRGVGGGFYRPAAESN